MERETRNHYHTRRSTGGGGGGSNYNENRDTNNYNASPNGPSSTLAEPELLLHWGNRKRLRCVKVQHKDDATSAKITTARVDRNSLIKADKDSSNPLLRRASPTHRRALRNSETAAMRTAAQQQQPQHIQGKGSRGGAPSPDGESAGKASASSDEKKGSSSGSDEMTWPKFVIALTNKEKEEDFLVFKGSKLPQRPKKRAKLIQRTLNLVSPGAWLCDLTLERYEVREKKISKKKPRGLKAMQNMDSDSE
ncbi:uncharacterized protein [Typha angustifolia]|uniref:uncharacterized protein n=1 Tax=Typha angustifolia TaxID=59011 RepID=UPI003C2B8D90